MSEIKTEVREAPNFLQKIKQIKNTAIVLKTNKTLDEVSKIISDSIKNEVKEIFSDTPYEKVSEETLRYLVPQIIYETANKPENIEIRQLDNETGEISILVLEKNNENLTDESIYKKWKDDIAKSKEEQKDRWMQILPPAPKEINRLHAKFESGIDKREIQLSDKILMTCKLRLYSDNKEALYIGDFDGEKGKGIGKDFYKNILPKFCNNLGLKFIVGKNNGQNISFFKDKLERFGIKDLKSEYQNTLFPNKINDDFFTIQFLNDNDKEKYLKKSDNFSPPKK